MSLRSPLGQVLGLGAAKEGAKHWWSQRLTAVALAVLGLWLLIAMLKLNNFEQSTVIAWLRHPLNATLMILFVGTATYHSVLGVQVVIEDYVHGPLKTASLILSNFAHVVVAVAAVVAVLRMAFGAAA